MAADTEVYVLIDRDRFQGVFATADVAKKEFALHVKQAFGVDELKWRESDGSWFLSSECKLGEVSVLKRRVLS
jgi:hypothetical protein